MLLKEYPKVDFSGVIMLAGMDKSDMPFEKEFIQAMIMKEILGKYVILLPRYATNTIKRVLGITLQKGSFADGFASLLSGDKYIEFKLSNKSNFIAESSKALKSSDIAFVAFHGISIGNKDKLKSYIERRIKNVILKGNKILFLADLDNKIIYKKEGGLLNLLYSPAERISRVRTNNEETLPPGKDVDKLLSTLKEYVYVSGNVKNNQLIDFEKYLDSQLSDILY